MLLQLSWPFRDPVLEAMVSVYIVRLSSFVKRSHFRYFFVHFNQTSYRLRPLIQYWGENADSPHCVSL